MNESRPVEIEMAIFRTAVALASRDIKRITNDNWGIIGSAALAIHDLIDYVPEDIDIIVSDSDLRALCIHYSVAYPEKTFSEDKRLCSNRIEIKLSTGFILDIAANLQYLTPHGFYELINVSELRTEYAIVNGECLWNVITAGTYMSLAGRFNRDKDRERLKKLHDLNPH